MFLSSIARVENFVKIYVKNAPTTTNAEKKYYA